LLSLLLYDPFGTTQIGNWFRKIENAIGYASSIIFPSVFQPMDYELLFIKKKKVTLRLIRISWDCELFCHSK